MWTSISESNFRKRNDLWNAQDRVKEEPYFGWLQTVVPSYGDTLNIKTSAVENEVGFIPSIRMIEEGHQLTIDQENGISFDKALEVVGIILSSGHSNK